MLAVALAAPAHAQTLKERLQHGAQAVGGAIDRTAKQVDSSIDSAVDLATNDPDPAVTRARLDTMAEVTLAGLFADQPAAREQFDVSAGYAVFDTRKASLLGVVAGFGRGVAVSLDTGARSYMTMGTGGVGFAFGIGGFESQVVILFETPADLDSFIRQGFDATAQAQAVAGSDKTGETLRFTNGRSFFVLDKKGWRVNASAAGTKYWLAPELN